MAIERETPYLPPEEKFDQMIGNKKSLWLILINESNLKEGGQESFRAIIEDFAQPKSYQKFQDGIDDAFYSAVSRLVGATEKISRETEANALFENLKADIWDFFNQIKK